MLILLPGHQFNLVWLVWGRGHEWGHGHTKVKVIPRSICKCFEFYWQAGGGPSTERHSCFFFSPIADLKNNQFVYSNPTNKNRTMGFLAHLAFSGGFYMKFTWFHEIWQISHEIQQISSHKSSGFHEIQQISWNWVDFIHEIWWISWNLADFIPEIGRFHEIQWISSMKAAGFHVMSWKM